MARQANERKSPGLEELRHVSRAAHDAVDQAFSRFDLSKRKSYGAFLTAHASALLAAEAYLSRYAENLPPWRPRGDLLVADLHEMGLPVPPLCPIVLADDPSAALGALYVLEGSRLGGRLLAGRVGEGVPRSYLSAVHLKGEWPDFLGYLGSVLEANSVERRQAVMDGVVRTFEMFRVAAGSQLED
ncbi:biliverdin-producing heme oxygenase [Gluconobacter kanchanaburiensis]|nr:biliverdin-producing heme oxygenase [Gluconobacter kanchanaburiensis]